MMTHNEIAELFRTELCHLFGNEIYDFAAIHAGPDANKEYLRKVIKKYIEDIITRRAKSLTLKGLE